jgi:hypothetical protein
MSAFNKSKSVPAKFIKGMDTVKPFCKVCHDAGKPESEYTNHFVRSSPEPNSVVVCPTLLALECRYCFQHGHTVKFCPIIADQKKAEDKALKQSTRKDRKDVANLKEIKSTSTAIKTSNAFSSLDLSDSDTETKKTSKAVSKTVSKAVSKAVEKSELKKKEEFPALCATKIAVPVMSGYATIAAKTKSQYDAEKYEQELIEKSFKRQLPPMRKDVATRRNWVDYSSDENDSDDEPQAVKITLNWSEAVDPDEDW